MVRKIIVFACMLALIVGIASTAQAATHTIYDNGTFSSTYVTYFKDILSGVSLTDNYVAFREDNSTYTMVTGDISYNEQTNTFTLNGNGKVYYFLNNETNNIVGYDYYETNDFTLTNDKNAILYSDLGSYPQLMERGAKYEVLATIVLCIMCLYFVVRLFFAHR